MSKTRSFRTLCRLGLTIWALHCVASVDLGRQHELIPASWQTQRLRVELIARFICSAQCECEL